MHTHINTISSTLRAQFNEFFCSNRFNILPTCSLIPQNDDSLLFTNAGMVPFKKFFLFENTPEYDKYASIQKCMRAGGKGCDIDNVGISTRHLSSFEMCGFFILRHKMSEQQIKHYAVELVLNFLCSSLGLDKNKIWLSTHQKDLVSFDVCLQFIPRERIVQLDDKDNFWAMGDTGPCGYCIEILVDRGPDFGGSTSPRDDISGDRFLEVWNLVFMQFNKHSDGTMTHLQDICVDTGGGLQRLAMLLENAETVFEIEEYKIVANEITKDLPDRYELNDKERIAIRMISDHIQSILWIISEGIIPGSQGRNYVLKKLIRRCVVQWILTLQKDQEAFERFLESVSGHFAPNISMKALSVILQEFSAVMDVMSKGATLLNKMFSRYKTKNISRMPVEDIFWLQDTHGIPLEYIQAQASNEGILVDTVGLDFYIKQKKLSEKTDTPISNAKIAKKIVLHDAMKSDTTDYPGFVGYTDNHVTSNILGFFNTDGSPITQLSTVEPGIVVTNKSALFAECGGQAADTGYLYNDHGVFYVTDTQKSSMNSIAHFGILTKGQLKIDQDVTSEFNEARRVKTSRAHSASHLLTTFVFKQGMKQVGAFVDEDSFRIDLTSDTPIDAEFIKEMENEINREILDGSPTKVEHMTLQEARDNPEIEKVFDDKYGDIVRMIEIGPSKALCGGTHVTNTSMIGSIKIIREKGIAAGKRRIEGVTGLNVSLFIQEQQDLLSTTTRLLGTSSNKTIPTDLEVVMNTTRTLKEQVRTLQNALAEAISKSIVHNNKESAVILEIPDEGIAKQLASKLIGHNIPIVILHYTSKISDITKIFIRTNDLSSPLNAHGIYSQLKERLPFKGGGTNNAIQAQCKNMQLDTSALQTLLKSLVC